VSRITLKKWLTHTGKTQIGLSKEIGVLRQTLNYWYKQDATVYLVEAGIGIRLKSGLIVYEAQVKK